MRYGRPYELCAGQASTRQATRGNGSRYRRLRAGDRPHPPRTAPPPPPLAGAAGAPQPMPPAGYVVEAAPPGDLGTALVGRTLLYWWPDDGWQRGTVARLCPRGAFSHVVACRVGAARHGGQRRTHCLTLPPAAPAGCFKFPCRPPPLAWPGPSALPPPAPLSFKLSRMTVRVTFARQSSQLLARSGPGPGGQRTFAYHVLLMMPLQPFPWPQRTLLLRPIVGVTVPVASGTRRRFVTCFFRVPSQRAMNTLQVRDTA